MQQFLKEQPSTDPSCAHPNLLLSSLSCLVLSPAVSFIATIFLRDSVDKDIDAAIVSLYLPILGDSGVAITADNVGTDSAGHTTWSVGPASSASGSLSTPDFDFAPCMCL